MKYSNYVGVLAGITLIVACFLPWLYISSIQTILTGLHTPKTDFGKPGMLNIILAFISIILFIVPAVWAKRINLFIGAFNLAWSIRNFTLFSQCESGECPEKKIGIFIVLIASIVLFIMALVPKIKLDK